MIAEMIVFLHGMLGGPSGFDPVEQELRRRGVSTPCARLRLPGHGLEPWGTDVGSFDAAVDALAARLPRAQRLTLVGYSLGGRLALALGAKGLSTIERVVAIGAHMGIEDREERSLRGAWDRSMAELVRGRGMAALVSAWEALPIFATQSSLEPVVLDRQRAVRLAHQAPAVAWAFETLGSGAMPPLADKILRSGVPVDLVAGERDDKYAGIARQLAARGASVIPGAGHNVLLEAPAAFAETLIKIFRRRAPQRVDESTRGAS